MALAVLSRSKSPADKIAPASQEQTHQNQVNDQGNEIEGSELVCEGQQDVDRQEQQGKKVINRNAPVDSQCHRKQGSGVAPHQERDEDDYG